jgi:hypothetical protein
MTQGSISAGKISLMDINRIRAGLMRFFVQASDQAGGRRRKWRKITAENR